ncbi:MAG: phosphatase PAP2 family protein [Gemmataceae bacterium]|nr:phosphatase PAP2 family protein [Gemmataceae bacterium]
MSAAETALTLLGVGTAAALLIRAGPGNAVALESCAATVLFASSVVALSRRQSERFQKARLVACYLFVVWFYFSVVRLVPTLESPLRDADLLAIDEACLVTTPAVWCQAWTTPWLTDLLSACYLSYHVYLSVALLHALWLPVAFARRLGERVFLAFGIGLPGYLLVPAIGPAKAFPELFTVPLDGGWPTRLNAGIVAHGSSVYDVFPSLHLLITCVLLTHDWRFVRRRFWVMIVPALGLVVSTVCLRYHYAVDLMAGLVLFLVIWRCFKSAKSGIVPIEEECR